MKPIAAEGLARRYAPKQCIAWLLELADGDWSWRGATLATNFNGNDHPARLGRVTRWREWLPDRGREGGRGRAQAELTVPDLPGGADSLRSALEARAPVGIAATLRLAWLDPDLLAPTAAATMLRGRLTAWHITPAGVELTLIDEVEAIGNRRIGRLLRPGMVPGAVTPMLGKPLPWIFGKFDGLELFPLDTGAFAKLSGAITAEQTTIPLATLNNFPGAGTVQIGDEMIHYNSIDADVLALGTSTHPVIRGANASDHNKGTIVRRIPAHGFLWLVADHLCRTVVRVQADGVPLDPPLWTLLEMQIAGRAAHVVSLPHWPLNADGNPAERMTAYVEGLADQDSNLIENPARVVEFLLTDEFLGALPVDRIDTNNISEIADALALREFKFAARLTGNETLGELLDSAAEESGLWIQPADPIRLIQADPVPHPALVAEDLDSRRLLDTPPDATVHAPHAFIPPDAVELIAAASTPGTGRAALIFPPERESDGTIPRRYAMRWLDLGTPAAIQIGELLWRRLSEAPFDRFVENPIGAALLGCGETVRVTDPPVEMNETLAWIKSIEVIDDTPATIEPERRQPSRQARAKLQIWGPWAGGYCWKFDHSNFIRRFAFGGHLQFVISGDPVALLTRMGTLRIAGRLRERATFTAGPFAGPIILSAGWIYFSTGASGAFTPFARLDASGDLELKGALRERSTLAIDPGGTCHGATSNRFWFSSDQQAGAADWRSDTQIFHLPGILIENARL